MEEMRRKRKNWVERGMGNECGDRWVIRVMGVTMSVMMGMGDVGMCDGRSDECAVMAMGVRCADGMCVVMCGDVQMVRMQ